MNVLKWTSRVGLALAGMVFPTAFTIAQVSIDLSSQQADLTLYGAGENSHFGQAVATGDLNGDGQKDLIIGAPGWAAPDQAPGGAVFIFWGRTNLQGSIDLSTETADVLISGSAGGGNLGASLFAADLDGDQIDDLVLGNPDFTPDTLTQAGAVYLFWGRSEWPAEINLDSVRADQVFLGGEMQEHLGNALSAGDINGDGRIELLISAWQGSYPGHISTGKVYVFLRPDSLPEIINLSRQNASTTIFGKKNNDFAGFALATADMNNDGLDDILIGAYKANSQTGLDAGEAYAVFGRVSWPDSLWLKETPPQLTVQGASGFDHLGYALAAGDFNQDGFSDWVIGARQANPIEGLTNSGAVYLLYGRETFPDIINLRDNLADVNIYGGDDAGFMGSSLLVGDINHDRLPDMILGAPRATAGSRREAGKVFFLLGRQPLPAVMDLRQNLPDLTIWGADSLAHLGTSLAAGDLNGDQFQDLLIGAENQGKSGAVYVFFGSPAVQVEHRGSREVSSPHTFELQGNMPNPFQQSTVIQFQTFKPQTFLKLHVVDLLGREIQIFHAGPVQAGKYVYAWDGFAQTGQAVPNGIYWLILESNTERQVRKMLLLR
ncbi:MAG: hypothetical protein D6814_07450 [Calditrichaeota bacterium]|nr:MAG: hypothetical protein D6814_07450 [Calditrichota bacterium]